MRTNFAVLPSICGISSHDRAVARELLVGSIFGLDYYVKQIQQSAKPPDE